MDFRPGSDAITIFQRISAPLKPPGLRGVFEGSENGSDREGEGMESEKEAEPDPEETHQLLYGHHQRRGNASGIPAAADEEKGRRDSEDRDFDEKYRDPDRSKGASDARDEPPPCLSWLQKLMFGLPQFNCNFGSAMLNSWLTYLYLPPNATPSETLIPAALFGTVFLLGRLLNAICDPLFGWVSDHSTLRYGRRLPFMFVGGPLLGVSFAALFFPPELDESSSQNTVYFSFVFAAFNIMNAFTTSPYTALLPELTGNKKERIHLATFSGLFALLGNLLGAAVGPIQYAIGDGFDFFGLECENGLQVMAILAGILHIIGFWLPLCFLRERPRAPKRPVNLFKEMGIAFRNPAFLSLLGVSCLLPLGVVFVSGGLPYLCTEILEREEGERGLVKPGKGEVWVGVLSGILVIGALLWFPLIGQLVKRLGKKRIMLTCSVFMSTLILAIAVVPFFPDPGVPTLIGVILLTLPAASSFVLPPAIYADVVDYDEERTGVRREGIYAGSQSFCNKCAMAIGSATIVYILSLGNSSENPLGIIVLFLVAGVIVFVATGIFSLHPIKN